MHHRAESQPFTSCNPNSPTHPLSPSHRHVKSHIFSIPIPLFAKNDNEKINTSEFDPLQSPSSDRKILISPDRIDNDTDLHKSVPIEEGSPEILDTIPTNRGTENKLSQKGEEPENLYTEDNFLITPFTYDLAEKLTRRKKEKQNEIEVKMSGSGWFGCKDWILTKIFRQKRGIEQRKISPEVIGTVNNAADLKLTEMRSQRAKRNWAKARYLYHTAKVAEALSLAMNEKEQRIERGKTMRDMTDKEDLDRWKALMRYWYISPNSKFCIFWRFIFQVASCYFILAIPYVLAFEIDSFEFNMSMYMLDIFYLMDIILHFFIAVEHPITGDLIYNRKTIALNYLKGTFAIDVISVFPYYLIDKRLQVLKLIRIPRLTLILYFVRQRIHEIANLFINEARAPRVASFISNFVSLLLILVVICHFGTCLWANLGFAATSGEKTWFYNLNLSIINANAGSANDFEIYTASLSQIIQTLTTVGYGNYTGFTAREYLVSMALEFFGIMLFVYFMQQIKYTFSQVDEVEAKQTEETEEVETWLNMIDRLGNQWRMIGNDKLLNKVTKILKSQSSNNWTELFTENGMLKMLPPSERLEVLKFSMKHITQQFSVFFRNISEVFQTELLAKAESKLFLENETIIQRGKRSPGVFFILEGNVLLALGVDEVISRNLVSGSFFGEMSIAVEKCSSMTYIAHNATQCILIRKEVFKEVGKKYAAEMKNLQRLAFYRHKYFLHVKQNIERGVDEDDVESYVNKASWVKSADLPNELHSPEQLKRKLPPIILPPINSGNPSFLRPSGSSPKASESPNSPISVDKSPRRVLLSPLPYPSPVMRSKVSSRLNESDVETIVSEGEEEEEENGNDEDEDGGSDNSELNQSDVFPLETFDLDFEKFDENQDLVGYFEDRIDYCQQKLKALKRQVNIAIDPLSKNMMKRIQHEINFAALAAADLKHSPSD